MCGASLPERPAGQRGRRSPHCDLCRPKHRYAKRKKANLCNARYLCRCGKPRNFAAAQCWACYSAARRRPIRVCRQCTRPFHPKRGVHPARRQVNKYCSRSCFFTSKRLRAEAVAMETAISRSLARAQRLQVRQQRHETRMVCPCGAAITRPTGRWCNSCYATQIANGIRAGRDWARVTGPDHLCPNCGQWFKGYQAHTFCSSHCQEQMSRMQARGRYPSIQHVPVDERNHLAELIALAREANRRIYKHG